MASSANTVQQNITDPGGQIIGTVSNIGAVPLPASAGIPATATVSKVGQIIAVHGTTAGVVVDIPSGK